MIYPYFSRKKCYHYSMNNIRLTYPLLYEVYNELKTKIKSNHFASISAINSSDVLISFSFYNKEKLFFSLNHSSPFISLVDSSFSLASLKGGFNENLRKILKGAFIEDIELKENDRVLTFKLTKNNDFFEKYHLYLILELIPTKANLIILDENKKIIYAYKYIDLTHNRPIIKGLEYISLPPRDIIIKDDTSMQIYKNEVNHYLSEASNKRQKELNKPLFDFLMTKRKSLIKKIDVLNKEIDEANKKLIYQEYGQYLFTYMYIEDSLNHFINEISDIYDKNKSVKENANRFFNIYKKGKRTIEIDNIELEKTNNEIEELTTYINTFTYLNEDEINYLYNKYLSFKLHKPLKIKQDAKMPFYIEYENTIIAFGKNSKQNDFLTFKKAKKDYMFFHVDLYSGSHVVIFKDNPNNEEMLLASEIALILSSLETGDVKYTNIKDIKKGLKMGEVIIDNYKLITLRNIRESTRFLLKNQKRFIS